jgi:hypothetical protein
VLLAGEAVSALARRYESMIAPAQPRAPVASTMAEGPAEIAAALGVSRMSVWQALNADAA